MSLIALTSCKKIEYQVLKCSCNGIDVISELVSNGYAVPRYTVSPKSSPVSNNLDKASCSRIQENHKSKKVIMTNANGKHAVTNVNGKHVDACNGIEKYAFEKNGGVNEQVNCRSSSLEPHQIQEFIPKKIIKRGSDTYSVTHQILGETKTVNHLLKIDTVMSNLKLINNIRGLVPLHTDDDLINKAIDLLRNVMDISISEDAKQHVENAYKTYCETLKALKDCSEEEVMLDLKDKKKLLQTDLSGELKNYLETFDSTLLDKRKEIQETITALESNSSAWLNVYLSKIPDTIEDLLEAFNKEKEKKRSSIDIARRNTEEKHKKFQKFLEDLGKEFSLNMVEGKIDDSYSISTEGKKGSWALKFDEVLTDFGISLEQEMTSSTVVKDQNSVSVIQCILEKLDIPKEKIDAECELYEVYKSLYDDLTYSSDLRPIFEELHDVQKIIQAFHSDNENGEKLPDKLLELHSALLREDVLMVVIAKAAAQHFPELVQEHPELKLKEYQKYSYLLKHSWDISFFPLFGKCSRIEPSYISKFADDHVVIKEFHVTIDCENAFMKKVKAWNEIRSNSVVKIKGLFKSKDENTIYAVLPSTWETLNDTPLPVPVDFTAALSVLQKVLEGLCDIHSRGIVHGAVHPMSILHKEGEVLLDFNFDKQCLQDKWCLKGINFQDPNDGNMFKSADMYGFGCLVLWVLFPNLSFNSTEDGVPDINPFLSIIQGMMFDKDFSFFSALLNVNSDIRPSSRVLLSNMFLKDLRIMSEATS